MEVKKSLMVLVFIFSLVACSQNSNIPTDTAVTPTFTPWVEGTQTALANPIPVAGTQTAIADSQSKYASHLSSSNAYPGFHHGKTYITLVVYENWVSSGYHEFEIQWSLPWETGVYFGLATFGFMGADDMVAIPVTIVLDATPPVIENLSPADGSTTGSS